MPKLRLIRVFVKRTAAAVIAYVVVVLGVTTVVPAPEAVAVYSPPRSANDVRFLADASWLDDQGERHIEQQTQPDICH